MESDPAPFPDAGAPLARVTRGDAVESWHRGALLVVRGGRVAFAAGDPQRGVWCRSAIKPLQALPLLELGVADRLDLTDEELAVICASHDGTPRHVAVVEHLLARTGLDEDALGCGPHAPFDKRAGLELARSGGKPRRVHNNCSGKHAGFLLLARELGQPLAEYLAPTGKAQLLVRRTVAEMAGVPLDDIDVATDGCGAPTLRLPLVNLALAFWRLANPMGLPNARHKACQRVLAAAGRHPDLIAADGRLDTELIRSAPGRLFAKRGAEGVYAVGIAGLDFAVAAKVDDGNERGYAPAVVHALRAFGLWPRAPEALAEHARTPVRNTNREVVGWVESALRF